MSPMVAAPRMTRITASTCGFASAARADETVKSEVGKKSYDGSNGQNEGRQFALFHGKASSLSVSLIKLAH